MRLLTLILILIAPLAIADTFQGRDYELFDVRTKARPAPLILNLHGAGSTAPRLPGSTALQRTTMSSSPTHPRQPIAGMTGAGGRWERRIWPRRASPPRSDLRHRAFKRRRHRETHRDER